MTDPDKARANTAQVMKKLREELPMLLEYERLNAELKRAKFTALVAAGFTDQQAAGTLQGLEGMKVRKGPRIPQKQAWPRRKVQKFKRLLTRILGRNPW